MTEKAETTTPATAFDWAIKFLSNVTEALPKTPEEVGQSFDIESYRIRNSLQYLRFELFYLFIKEGKTHIIITAGGGYGYEFLIGDDGKIKPLYSATDVIYGKFKEEENNDWFDPKDLVQKWIDSKRAPKVGVFVSAIFCPNLWAQEHVRKLLKKIDNQLPYQLKYDAEYIDLDKQLTEKTGVRLLHARFYCEEPNKKWTLSIRTSEWFEVEITDAGWIIPTSEILWDIFEIDRNERKTFSPEEFLAIWKKSHRAKQTYKVFAHIFGK